MSNLRLASAICRDQAVPGISHGCRADAGLKPQWDKHRGTCGKLMQDADDSFAACFSVMCKEEIVRDFIDSVRCVANRIAIDDLATWLDDESDGSTALQEIKKEFKKRCTENPAVVRRYLKQRQADVLSG